MRLAIGLLAFLFAGVVQLAHAAPNDGHDDPAPRASSGEPRATAEEAVVGDLILQAMSLMGIAYRFGGTTPTNGFDCSGFIRYIFQRSIGVNLPRTAAEQAQIGRSIDRSELKPGDIVFFNTRGFANSHNGLYIGNGRFVHAPRTGKNIEIASMSASYWAGRFNGARRINRGNAFAGDVRDEVVAKKPRERDAIAQFAEESGNTASASSSAPVLAAAAIGATGLGAAALLSERKKERETARRELYRPVENTRKKIELDPKGKPKKLTAKEKAAEAAREAKEKKNKGKESVTDRKNQRKQNAREAQNSKGQDKNSNKKASSTSKVKEKTDARKERVKAAASKKTSPTSEKKATKR